MHTYCVDTYPGRPIQFAVDLKAVKAVIRSIPKDGRYDVRITLSEFRADKPTIISILNGHEPVMEGLRKWRVSPRGRLIEIDINEE